MGKVEQSWEWSSALPYTSFVAIEKGAFGSPSTKVANFIYQSIYSFFSLSLAMIVFFLFILIYLTSG